MNRRSIHFRLALWYSTLVLSAVLIFCVYTYGSLRTKLYEHAGTVLTRRIQRIETSILPNENINNMASVARHISEVYSPEINSWLIRINSADGKILYTSGNPREKNFIPSEIPVFIGSKHEPVKRVVKISSGGNMVVVTSPSTLSGQLVFVDVGAPVEQTDAVLSGLIIIFLIGIPFVVLMATGGGYILVQRSLQQVEDIRLTAEKISFSNLKNRLPVSRTGDAIERLSITLNQMIERLESVYQQVSRFSADASHELRTPLTIMRSELESAVREPSLPEHLRERLGSVLEEAEHLSRTTENLFSISRLDAGEAKMENMVFDLGKLAMSTAEQMLLLAEEKNTDVKIDVAGAVPVEGDRARMKQVIVNLMGNAIKYTPESGKIQLKVSADDNKAIMQIKDSGIGIPSEAMPHLFERFFRADKVRSRKMGGAGLGLAIVRSICHAHGGNVFIESKEGLGTIVTVELPLAGSQ